MDSQYVIPAIPSGGWTIGDEVIIGIRRYKVIGKEGLFHLMGFPCPIFVSQGSVAGISRETGMKDCSVLPWECYDHDPPCVGRIRYQEVSRIA
jgi:hypothetical protein